MVRRGALVTVLVWRIWFDSHLLTHSKLNGQQQWLSLTYIEGDRILVFRQEGFMTPLYPGVGKRFPKWAWKLVD